MMHCPTLALGLLLLAAPFVAEAQPTGKVPRIGFLANVRSPATEAFQKGLRELGYVEGQNIIVEWRLAEGRFERLPELAAELVRLSVDVIIAPAPPYVQAARQATTRIPIIFALVPDPVGQGFVESLAKPGGNITGLASRALELHGKRLQLLKEAVPGLAHVGILTNPTGADEGLREVERAAALLGIQRDVVTVARPDEMHRAFALIKAKSVGAVLEVPGGTTFYAHRQRIADLALQTGLPMMCSAKEFVEAGCLLYYGPSFPDLMRRSARYVHRILNGAQPADLPVEQPTTFELSINLKTAKALGLTIPPAVLARADRIIE